MGKHLPFQAPPPTRLAKVEVSTTSCFGYMSLEVSMLVLQGGGCDQTPFQVVSAQNTVGLATEQVDR